MTRAQVGTLGAVGAILGLGAYGLLGAGTTPIGTASELSAWPQGRADAPLCIYGQLTDGGFGCVGLLGTQDGGDVIPFPVASGPWVDGGPGFTMPISNKAPNGLIPMALSFRATNEGSGFVQDQYPDSGGKSEGSYVDSTGCYFGTNTADDLQLYTAGGVGQFSFTQTGDAYNAGKYFDDGGGYCFRDHTCQTTAATSAYANGLIDGGGATANGDVQLDPAVRGLYFNGTFTTYFAGTAQKDIQVSGGGSGQLTCFDSLNQQRGQICGTSDWTIPRNSLEADQFIGGDAGMTVHGSFVAPITSTGTQQGIEVGTATLSSGAATVTFSPAFASGTPVCVCTDASSVLSAKCSATSTTLTVTVTTGGSDGVNWNCVGNR